LAVDKHISPNDLMCGPGGQKHYLAVGDGGLRAILAAMSAVELPKTSIRDILDFGCGHGRVLRHIRAYFPDSNIFVCDTNGDGVDYCVRTFRAKPLIGGDKVLSRPKQYQFDLVWLGSVFTHLPHNQWIQLFDALFNCVRPKDLLVFTTAGRHVERLLAGGELGGVSQEDAEALSRSFKISGFGYGRYSRGIADYGRSLVLPSFVLSLIESTRMRGFALFMESHWDRRQDVYAVYREQDRAIGKTRAV